MTDSHSGRDSMRVHDHVRDYTLSSEGQVFLSISHTTCTLLTMSTSELVSYLRYSDSSHLDLGKGMRILICSDDDLIDDAIFCVLQWCGAVFPFLSKLLSLIVCEGVLRNLGHLSDDNIISTHKYSWLH
jgi:hypothetical protein